MKELLQIEYLKIKNYTVFRAFILLFIIMVPLIFWSLSLTGIPFFPSQRELFGFPTVWPYLTYITSYCMIFPAILIVVLVCNDITYRTQKQNVIDGLSRKQVVFSKFYLVLVSSILITAFVFLIGAIFGSVFSSVSSIFKGIEALFYFWVQTLGYLTLALLIGVLLRKTSLSVMLYLVVFFIFGMVIRGMAGQEIAQWTPINMLNNLVPFPFFKQILEYQTIDSIAVKPFELSQNLRLILILGYISLFVVFSYSLMKKRDL